MGTAVYGLSADPATNGHARVIRYGAENFDRLIVVLATNPDKKHAFHERDRMDMLRQIAVPYKNVEVVSLLSRRLLVRFAADERATTLLRGIRNNTDHEYEQMMSHFNEWLEPTIRTLYVGPEPGQPFVSSSFVKALVGMEGWKEYVSQLVPLCVMPYLLELEKERYGA